MNNINEKIEFLNKYTLNEDKVELLDINEVKEIPDNIIPREWKNIFNEVDMRKRINQILYIWKLNVGEEMSNTISFLEEFLKEIDLMKIGEKYSVLYTIVNEDNEIEYYQGNNPYEKRNNKSLDEFFESLPKSLQDFYNKLHNGFYYYPSKGMGLSAYNDILHLSDEEWGIIEDIGEENLQLNLETSFGFFSNSMGTYVAIDFEKDIDRSILWSAKDEPEYDLNFWDVIDEWTVIGFQ